MTDSIHVENGYQKDAYTYYPVLIVGAGATGLAMGCRLKQNLGFDQFRIFDRQSGIGGTQWDTYLSCAYIVLSKIIGTWWINRYPGVVSFIMDYMVAELTRYLDRPATCMSFLRVSLPVFLPHIKPQTFRILFLLVCTILHLRVAFPNRIRLHQIPP